MKTYVMTTGIVFAVLTILHIWRAIAEGSQLATQPMFLLLTLASAGLCAWAVRLLLRSPQA